MARTLAFFDTSAVQKAVNRAERYVLNQIGRRIRQTSRQSIRKQSKTGAPSKPGSPPKSRTGYLKRGILYAYEFSSRSVVIGPIRGAKSGDVTHALEHAGTTPNTQTGKQQRIQARPFMGPALEKRIPELPQLWRDSVRP